MSGKIDRERFAWINLTAKASDSGTPRRSSFVPVLIQVRYQFSCSFYCRTTNELFILESLSFRYWTKMTIIRNSSTFRETFPFGRTLHPVSFARDFVQVFRWKMWAIISKHLSLGTGTVIGSVEALDLDIGDFGHVTYLMDRRSSKVVDHTNNKN